MRTLFRYALLLFGTIVYCLLLFGEFGGPSTEIIKDIPFWDEVCRPRKAIELSDSSCTMQSCFNFTKCLDAMKMYVYPNSDGEPLSGAYLKILTSIRESTSITSNPSEACLFVLAIDTSDRDKISENYVRDVNDLIANLPAETWNNGENHVIFNLYHGTYPDYADHNLGFNTGKSIIARASPGVQHFRFGFDISFPLFHKEHNLRGRIEREYNIHGKDQYLVSFKGKRYVYGIGSETRDALHHLHNGINVAMVTTCRHNNDWKEHQDSRCEKDNEEYDRWDYQSTMANSTFCLTPRGRRLGSFRFLESLRLGCIPVVLSDDWVLPFAEVIDWSAAIVVVAEDNVLLVPDILYSFSPEKVVRMKERCRFLYNRYFRDVESITMSSLRIIFDRVRVTESLPIENWNLMPAASMSSSAPVSVIIRVAPKTSNRLQRVFDIILKVPLIEKVFILWPSERGVPPIGADFGSSLTPTFILTEKDQTSLKYVDGPVVYVDERMEFNDDDLRLLLSYFNLNPLRVIGVHGIDYDISTGQIHISTNYNSLFPSLVAFHGKYLTHLLRLLPTGILTECFLVYLNIISSNHVMQPPLVVGKHKIQPWMNLKSYVSCWNKISTRYPLGPPTFYSDLHYV